MSRGGTPYYAIIDGLGGFTGVATSWAETFPLVNGISGARHKKFKSFSQASDFIHKHRNSPPAPPPASNAISAISAAFAKARKPLEATRFVDEHQEVIIEAIEMNAPVVRIPIDEQAYRSNDGIHAEFTDKLVHLHPGFRAAEVGQQDNAYYVLIHLRY